MDKVELTSNTDLKDQLSSKASSTVITEEGGNPSDKSKQEVGIISSSSKLLDSSTTTPTSTPNAKDFGNFVNGSNRIIRKISVINSEKFGKIDIKQKLAIAEALKKFHASDTGTSSSNSQSEIASKIQIAQNTNENSSELRTQYVKSLLNKKLTEKFRIKEKIQNENYKELSAIGERDNIKITLMKGLKSKENEKMTKNKRNQKKLENELNLQKEIFKQQQKKKNPTSTETTTTESIMVETKTNENKSGKKQRSAKETKSTKSTKMTKLNEDKNKKCTKKSDSTNETLDIESPCFSPINENSSSLPSPSKSDEFHGFTKGLIDESEKICKNLSTSLEKQAVQTFQMNDKLSDNNSNKTNHENIPSFSNLKSYLFKKWNNENTKQEKDERIRNEKSVEVVVEVSSKTQSNIKQNQLEIIKNQKEKEIKSEKRPYRRKIIPTVIKQNNEMKAIKENQEKNLSDSNNVEDSNRTVLLKILNYDPHSEKVQMKLIDPIISADKIQQVVEKVKQIETKTSSITDLKASTLNYHNNSMIIETPSPIVIKPQEQNLNEQIQTNFATNQIVTDAQSKLSLPSTSNQNPCPNRSLSFLPGTSLTQSTLTPSSSEQNKRIILLRKEDIIKAKNISFDSVQQIINQQISKAIGDSVNLGKDVAMGMLKKIYPDFNENNVSKNNEQKSINKTEKCGERLENVTTEKEINNSVSNIQNDKMKSKEKLKEISNTEASNAVDFLLNCTDKMNFDDDDEGEEEEDIEEEFDHDCDSTDDTEMKIISNKNIVTEQKNHIEKEDNEKFVNTKPIVLEDKILTDQEKIEIFPLKNFSPISLHEKIVLDKKLIESNKICKRQEEYEKEEKNLLQIKNELNTENDQVMAMKSETVNVLELALQNEFIFSTENSTENTSEEISVENTTIRSNSEKSLELKEQVTMMLENHDFNTNTNIFENTQPTESFQENVVLCHNSDVGSVIESISRNDDMVNQKITENVIIGSVQSPKLNESQNPSKTENIPVKNQPKRKSRKILPTVIQNKLNHKNTADIKANKSVKSPVVVQDKLLVSEKKPRSPTKIPPKSPVKNLESSRIKSPIQKIKDELRRRTRTCSETNLNKTIEDFMPVTKKKKRTTSETNSSKKDSVELKVENLKKPFFLSAENRINVKKRNESKNNNQKETFLTKESQKVKNEIRLEKSENQNVNEQNSIESRQQEKIQNPIEKIFTENVKAFDESSRKDKKNEKENESNEIFLTIENEDLESIEQDLKHLGEGYLSDDNAKDNDKVNATNNTMTEFEICENENENYLFPKNFNMTQHSSIDNEKILSTSELLKNLEKSPQQNVSENSMELKKSRSLSTSSKDVNTENEKIGIKFSIKYGGSDDNNENNDGENNENRSIDNKIVDQSKDRRNSKNSTEITDVKLKDDDQENTKKSNKKRKRDEESDKSSEKRKKKVEETESENDKMINKSEIASENSSPSPRKKSRRKSKIKTENENIQIAPEDNSERKELKKKQEEPEKNIKKVEKRNDKKHKNLDVKNKNFKRNRITSDTEETEDDTQKIQNNLEKDLETRSKNDSTENELDERKEKKTLKQEQSECNELVEINDENLTKTILNKEGIDFDGGALMKNSQEKVSHGNIKSENSPMNSPSSSSRLSSSNFENSPTSDVAEIKNKSRRGRPPKAVKIETVIDEAEDNKKSTSQQSNDRKLHPMLLLVTNRYDLDKEIVNENDNKMPGKDEFKCGLCKEIITKRSWTQHLTKHYGIGWKEGIEQPINIESFRTVTQSCIRFMKDNKIKSLKCRLCNEQKRSGLGLIGHVEICNLTEDEKMKQTVKCEYCDKSYLRSTIKIHVKSYCPVALKDVKKENEVEQQTNENDNSDNVILTNTGRYKRQSVIKAEKKFSEENFEEKFTDDKCAIPYKPLSGSALLWKFKLKIKSHGVGKCIGVKCDYESSDIDELLDHHDKCEKVLRDGYVCIECNYHNSDKNLITQHFKSAHKKEKNAKRRFSDSGSEASVQVESSSTEDNEDDGDEDENDEDDLEENGICQKNKKTKTKWKGKSETAKDKQYHQLIHWEGHLEEVKLCWQRTLQFYNLNFSENTLFPYAIPILQKLQNPLLSYFPKNLHSMKFTINKGVKYNKNFGKTIVNTNNEWQQIERFAIKHLMNDEQILFMGGSITFLKWLPIMNKTIKKQYLLIACKNDIYKFTKLFKPKSMQTILLLYEIDLNKKLKTDTYIPKLLYGITVDNGPVHYIEFLPNNGYSLELNRLGLMAIGCIKSDIKIFSLPINIDKNNINCDNVYVNNNNEQLLFINLKPIIILKLDLRKIFIDNYHDIWEQYKETQCVKICWSKVKNHNIIAGAYCNGYVAIWNIEDDDDNLNKFIICGVRNFIPICYFQATVEAITGLDLHYDDNGVRWLMITTNWKNVITYDVKDLSKPRLITNKNDTMAINDSLWPIIWENPIYVAKFETFNKNGSLNSVSPLDIHYSIRQVFKLPSEAITLDYNNWYNTIAIGSLNGDFYICNATTLNLNLKQRSITGRYMKISYTDLIRLDKNEELMNNEINNMQEYELFDPNYLEKYGLVIGPLTDCDENDKDLSKMSRIPPIWLNTFVKINKVAYNNNENGNKLCAIGYENGLVRIKYL